MNKLSSKEIQHTHANIKKISNFFKWGPKIILNNSIESYLK